MKQNGASCSYLANPKYLLDRTIGLDQMELDELEVSKKEFRDDKMV